MSLWTKLFGNATKSHQSIAIEALANALHDAAFNGNVDLVRVLLNQGIDANAKGIPQIGQR